MKSLFKSLPLALIVISQTGFAFDCASVTVRPLPTGEEAKSIVCVTSGHANQGNPDAPIIGVTSLYWTLGSQEQACKEAFSANLDPNATFEYCAESTHCPTSPSPQPFNCGVKPF